ncbi:MAG: carboxymuconolactone decarboxylase family protein [Acidimicrobiia bacterium]
MGSERGISNEKLDAVLDWEASDLFDADERLALEYADAITYSDRDVSDELFARLRDRWDDDTLVELTATIAWESSSSKFNRALRIPSQGLWKGGSTPR